MGEGRVEVILLASDGNMVARRSALLSITGEQGVRLMVSRNCAEVRCPESGSDPRTECVNGACVDPRCADGTEGICGEVTCSEDDDCPLSGDCANTICLDGSCFARLDDEACTMGRCTVDGCTGCDTRETDCMDGEDNDCDSFVDCADSDCMGVMCDDGIFCNGADTCESGTCSGHAGYPCSDSDCNEALNRCAECVLDTECGEPTMGEFGGCTYSDECDERGARTRDIVTPTCDFGVCVDVTTTDSRSCTRDRAGRDCDGGRRCFNGGAGSHAQQATMDR